MTVQSPILSGSAKVKRLPEWFRQEIPGKEALALLERLRGSSVSTVCRHAACPNMSSCFKAKKLTFMILGTRCTRSCNFCAVGKWDGSALGVDTGEPQAVASFIKDMGLRYAVITSVTRDDLPDGGSGVFADTILAVKALTPAPLVEALIPDFSGDTQSLRAVIAASPDVLAHNLETVERLYPALRPQAGYLRSLEVLSTVKKIRPHLTTKSSLMLGLGESREEVTKAFEDLRRHGCDMLALGQYLAPSALHYPVREFISVRAFDEYRQIALGMGFKTVCSGPLVRSSFEAEEAYQACHG
ncbi:MAG: lipoyl synthase [Candidatus Omnitrophica bacterium]|nr:lipoyl synthase [Candidatus Omnitrophota bacterium]